MACARFAKGILSAGYLYEGCDGVAESSNSSDNIKQLKMRAIAGDRVYNLS
jgi:hypothetical protein